jgi:hypothetical protein
MYQQLIATLYDWLHKYQVSDAGYNQGGILDPVDNCVCGDHYATTHFALLSALLYRKTGKKDYLRSCLDAMHFHCRTYPGEYREGDWGYHWDFKNFAFVEAYLRIRTDITEADDHHFLKAVKDWKLSKNPGTNWKAMEAYVSLQRYELLGRTLDFINYKFLMFQVYQRQLADGCFADFIGRRSSYPISYHVFVLALLHRLYLQTKSHKLKARFLRGVHYLLPFINPDGDFNVKGRGQEQIFGYGTAIYVLEAAKQLDQIRADEYRGFIDLVVNYILRFQREDGHIPLVLNSHRDEEKLGWYDYHHLSVYEAFFAAWIALADELDAPRVSPSRAMPLGVQFFKSSKTVVVKTDSYHTIISGGEKKYPSGAGASLHYLWGRDVGDILPTVGGPAPKAYGKINTVEHIEQAINTPLLKVSDEWVSPVHHVGKVYQLDNCSFRFVVNCGAYLLDRKVQFEEHAINFMDDISLQIPRQNIQLFRYFNLLVFGEPEYSEQLSLREIELLKAGDLIARVVFKENDNMPFVAVPRIKTAKGWGRVVGIESEAKNLTLQWELIIV